MKYTVSSSSFTSRRLSRGINKSTGWVIALVVGLILLNIVLTVGALVALIWGISNVVAVGASFWNITAIVVGGLILLNNIVWSARR